MELRRLVSTMLGWLEKKLSKVECVFGWMWDLLLLILTWVVLVRPEWKHLRQGRKDYDAGARQKFDPGHAEYLFERSEVDSEHTDSKTKELMTLSGLLTPIALVLAKDALPRLVALALVGALVSSVLLCVAILSKRMGVFPTLEPADGAAEELDTWAWDVHCATVANQSLHMLRVDICAAAHRFLRIAFLLALLLAVLSIGKPARVGSGAADLRGSASATGQQRDTLRGAQSSAPPPTNQVAPAKGGSAVGTSTPKKDARR